MSKKGHLRRFGLPHKSKPPADSCCMARTTLQQLLAAEKSPYLFSREGCSRQRFTAYDRCKQLLFPCLEVHHLLLDGVLCHQPVHHDSLRLPNSMGSIHGLGFCGWVPPGIEHEAVVGLSEVEAEATRLQADQEYRR